MSHETIRRAVHRLFWLLLSGFAAPVASAALVAAVLPSSRSVQTGIEATVFATMVNAGSQELSNCRVEADPGFGVELTYQTTSAATNELTGAPNSPVDLDIGQSQSFLLVLSSQQSLTPVELFPRFVCDAGVSVDRLPGVNTLQFSASENTVADVIALSATPTRDGVVVIPGEAGIAAFSVATVNLGNSTTIRAAVDLASSDVQARISLCQTDPATSVCTNPSTPSSAGAVLEIPAGDTPTFAVFVQAVGNIPFDPANNRALVRFFDSDDVLRGGTSVALRLRGPDDSLIIESDNVGEVLQPGLEMHNLLFKLAFNAIVAYRGATSFEGTSRPCGDGSITYRINDRTGDSRLRAGDSLELIYDNCPATSQSSVVLTGSVTLDVLEFFVTTNNEVRTRIAVTANDLSYQFEESAEPWSIDLNFQLNYLRSERRELVEIFEHASNRLRARNSVDDRLLSNFSLSKEFRLEQRNSYRLSLAGNIRSTALGGSMQCVAESVLGAGLAGRFVNPSSGTYRCVGEGGDSVALAASGDVTADIGGVVVAVADSAGWESLGDRISFSSRWLSSEWPAFAELPALPLLHDLDVSVVDVAASDLTGLIYVSNIAGIIAFDPVSGRLADAFPMEVGAGVITVSDDGSTMYVAHATLPSFQTLDLQTGTFGPVQDLGPMPVGTDQMIAADIVFLPGSTTDVVVSLQNPTNRTFVGTAFYANGVRAERLGPADPEPRFMEFHNGRLFAVGSTTLAELIISTDGVELGATLDGFLFGFNWRLQSVDGRLYSDVGRVVDFDERLLVGEYGRGAVFKPASALHVTQDRSRVLVLSNEELVVYDAERFVPIAEYPSPWSSSDRSFTHASLGSYWAVASGSRLLILDSRELDTRVRNTCPTQRLGDYFPGTNATQIPCLFTDFELDSSRNRIYAAVPGVMGEPGNSIAVINQLTTEIERFIAVGSDPAHLAISEDSSELVVAFRRRNTLARIDLNSYEVTEVVVQPIPQPSGYLQGTVPVDLATVSSSDGGFMMSLADSVREQLLALQLFDSDAELQVTRFGDVPATLVPAENGVVFGLEGGMVREFTPTGSRFNQGRRADGQIFSRGTIGRGSLLYDAAGYRFDALAFAGERRFLVPGGALAVAADPSSDELLYLARSTFLLYLASDSNPSFGRGISLPRLAGQIRLRTEYPTKISAELADRYVLMSAGVLIFLPKEEVDP